MLQWKRGSNTGLCCAAVSSLATSRIIPGIFFSPRPRARRLFYVDECVTLVKDGFGEGIDDDDEPFLAEPDDEDDLPSDFLMVGPVSTRPTVKIHLEGRNEWIEALHC